MADWKKLAKAALLADGRLDKKEVGIIRTALLADGKLDRSELEFLLELRRDAESVVQDFHTLVFEALKPVILADGGIDAKEAKWLEKFIYADGKVDDAEKEFFRQLKGSAKSVSPEFEALYAKVVG